MGTYVISHIIYPGGELVGPNRHKPNRQFETKVRGQVFVSFCVFVFHI